MHTDAEAVFFSKYDALFLPEDQQRYSTNWTRDLIGMPRVVVRPRTTSEVSSLIGYCASHNIPVVPQGGNTGLVGGATPSADGVEVILSLERLKQVREIDTANFTMIVEAGSTLQDVQIAADNADCLFPLRLGSQGSSQIGGNIATNAGGLNVLRYGMARELVLGLEVVLPDGRIWNGLKKLRKNNTGYDLKQIFLGSEGTLGVITAACLKLFPKPTHVETAFLAVESPFAAIELLQRARRELCDLLSAFELMPRNCVELSLSAIPDQRDPLDAAYPYYILLEATASGPIDLPGLLQGFLSGALEDGLVSDCALAANLAHANAFWRIREGINEGQAKRGLHLRTDVSIPISRIAPFLSATGAALSTEEPDAMPLAYGHLGDGNIHYNAFAPDHFSEQEALDLFHRCEAIIFRMTDLEGGSISAEHGIGQVKRGAFLNYAPEVDLDLLRRIKGAIDPLNIMNPNRIF